MAYKIPFIHELEFDYGGVSNISPLVRRVIAHNPGPFTFKGTGTYIIGRGEVAVIDPGPLDPDHVASILKAVEGEVVTHILITHTHIDHSPAAKLLKAETGAPAYGFGPHPVYAELSQEGGDMEFRPDVVIADGDIIEGNGWTMEAIHTPGHTSNHICFRLKEENAVFTGDHVMGWSTTIVSPPDGDMTAYYQSLQKLLDCPDDEVYYPTHGAPIPDVHNYVRAYLEHRQGREAQIVDVLSRNGAMNIPDMVKIMYADVPEHLHRPAGRSVLAHLIHMVSDGRIKTGDAPTADAVYELA